MEPSVASCDAILKWVNKSIAEGIPPQRFVEDEVKRLENLQRSNYGEYEATRALFTKALDDEFSGPLGKQVFCVIIILWILVRLKPTPSERESYYPFLSSCLRCAPNTYVLQYAVEVLSITLLYDDTATLHFAKRETDEALRRIERRDYDKFHLKAGVMILGATVKNIPKYKFFPWNAVFGIAWRLLACEDRELQGLAAQLLEWCVKGLEKLDGIDAVKREAIYEILLQKMLNRLKSSCVERNIAGFLAFDAVVRNASWGSLILNYSRLESLIEPYLDLTDKLQMANFCEFLLSSLESLCRFEKNFFISHHLKRTVEYALAAASLPQKRKAVFDVLSSIIEMVEDVFSPYVEQTCEEIRNVFAKSDEPCWKALECFSVICRLCPPRNLPKNLEACVHYVFHWGLSPELLSSLHTLLHIAGSTYRAKLERALLDKISVTLRGVSFDDSAVVFGRLVSEPIHTDTDVTLALNALMEFSFSRTDVMSFFLRDSVLPFISSSVPSIRNAAVKAIMQLLLPVSPKVLSADRKRCIDVVLEKMLKVAVAHEDHQLRLTILTHFTPDWCPFLSDEKYVNHICRAVGDESILCANNALLLLCKMANYDISHTLPVISKVLCSIRHRINIKFLVEEHRLVCFRLLFTLFTHAPQYVVNFSEDILDLLLELFPTTTEDSCLFGPFLHVATAVVTTAKKFGPSNCTRTFKKEIEFVLAYLDRIPNDQIFFNISRRLLCFRFLSAALSPTIGLESPYQIFPDIFRHISSLLHSPDEHALLRCEAVKCFGKIGALDVTTFQGFEAQHRDVLPPIGTNVILSYSSPGRSDCCNIVLRAIRAIVDPTDKRYIPREQLVREGLRSILAISRTCPSSHSSMHVMIAPLARTLQEMTSRSLDSFLLAYVELLCIARETCAKDRNEIFALFYHLWQKEPTLRYLAVHIISTLSRLNVEAFSSNARSFAVIGTLLDSLDADICNPSLCFSILGALILNAGWLQPLCELVIESVLNSIEIIKHKNYVLTAVKALQILCLKLHVSAVMGRIVRSLAPLLSRDYDEPELKKQVTDVFAVLRITSREDFEIYSDTVMEQLKSSESPHHEFSIRGERRFKGSGLVDMTIPACIQDENKAMEELLGIIDKEVREKSEKEKNQSTFLFAPTFKEEVDSVLMINEEEVRVGLDDLWSGRVKLEKWNNHFCRIVLKESPFQVFRCVSVSSQDGNSLAAECPAFASEIVPLGFRTLWSYSSAELRAKFLDFFNHYFHPTSKSILPDEAMDLLLSIVEFMDHSGEPLDIEYGKLSDCAWYRGLLAKAVYWREAAYCNNPRAMVDSLIGLYSELHMTKSSLGIFNSLSEDDRRPLLRSSLMKLGRYKEALKLAKEDLELQEKEQQEPVEKTTSLECKKPVEIRRLHRESSSHHLYRGKFLSSQGFNRSLHSVTLASDSESLPEREAKKLQTTTQLMLCMDKIGDYSGVMEKWDEIKTKAERKKGHPSHLSTLAHVSEYAADACIRLQQWPRLEEILQYIPNDTVPYNITRAIRLMKLGKFSDALNCVTVGRRLLLEDVSHIHDSYARSYDTVIIAQTLTDLEELIRANIFHKDFHVRKPLQHAKELFKEHIQLMVPNVRTWKRALLLQGLLLDPSTDVSTQISFINLCRMENASEEEKSALSQLCDAHILPSFPNAFKQIENPEVQLEYLTYAVNANELDKEKERELLKEVIDMCSTEGKNTLIARAYARLGATSGVQEALECYRSTTLHDPNWHIGWRSFAEVNAELLNENYSDAALTSAIDGYIRSILHGASEVTVIQDVLKLLTLWTTHCDQPRGLKELRSRVFILPTTVWHLVVPQLIAHLDSGSDGSCQLVAEIVTSVSLDYPNTLFFPLNLCRVSNAEGITKSDRRKRFAIEIVKKMEEKYPVLILQGKLVTGELTRLCSLIHERVFDKLHEANINLNRKSIEEMLRVLRSLHASLPTCPQSVDEIRFLSLYGKSLEEAEQWINVYVKTQDVVALQSAWCIYGSIYKPIQEQLTNDRTLDMSFYSPELSEAHDLDFCLPDDNLLKGKALSKISKFNPTMIIINSKQRPKRLSLTTCDGRTQKFLLKGKEDLRLDERVMQLFALINIVMRSDSRSTENIGFRVEQYTVTPLTEVAGLIGWVDGCDSLFELIKNYREKRNVLPLLEFSLLSSLTTSKNMRFFERLPHIGKIEALEFLADRTSGHDLRKVMWATTETCEIWIDKRRRYMTSLANMSMVGYILGLGDRHLNNIMLQKKSGQIVHIDFGDCFEVGMARERFPEKVPFRLTRMVRNPLDVSQLNGAFRSFCETSMSVLRKERDSMLALLQAFIHDPLISWRLVATSGSDPEGSTQDESTAEEEGRLLEEENSYSTATGGGAGGGGSSAGNATQPVRSAEARSLKTHHSNNFLLNRDFQHQGTDAYKRLKSKLEGKDFEQEYRQCTSKFGVQEQVNQLLKDATEIANVSQMFPGWMPFW